MNAKKPSLTAVVFDVVGTLVDSQGTIFRELAEVLERNGIKTERVASFKQKWSMEQDMIFEAILAGKHPYIIEDEVRRKSLKTTLAKEKMVLPTEDFERLATVGTRYTPWEQVPEQLAALCRKVKTIGLTNSGLGQIVEVAALGKLQWHTLLSAQLVASYKPDPKVYRFAIESLNLNPKQTVFVSTHPWDLRAAAKAGFQTAYIPRKYVAGPKETDHFDWRFDSLDELVALF